MQDEIPYQRPKRCKNGIVTTCPPFGRELFGSGRVQTSITLKFLDVKAMKLPVATSVKQRAKRLKKAWVRSRRMCSTAGCPACRGAHKFTLTRSQACMVSFGRGCYPLSLNINVIRFSISPILVRVCRMGQKSVTVYMAIAQNWSEYDDETYITRKLSDRLTGMHFISTAGKYELIDII